MEGSLISNLMDGVRALLVVFPWPALVMILALTIVARALWVRGWKHRLRAEWERSRRMELEAYSGLEATLPVDMEARKLAEQAKRICRLIAEKSCYARASFYLRNSAGEMMWAGSCGMDDLTLAALKIWIERVVLEEGTESARDSERRGQDAVKSFSVVLGARESFDAQPGRELPQATIVPLRMVRGRLVGAIAVGTKGLTELKETEALEAIAPVQLLAGRIASFIERGLLVQRLMEVERLAVAGQIVAGVAREMSEPLTAVLGIAEMMSDTATEPMVRRDTGLLVAHALTMQKTLDRLRSFWRPRAWTDDEAEVSGGSPSQDAP